MDVANSITDIFAKESVSAALLLQYGKSNDRSHGLAKIKLFTSPLMFFAPFLDKNREISKLFSLTCFFN
jgi:hypothetical protein